MSTNTVSLYDVLAAPQLCGTIQGTTTGIPDVFPPEFYQIDKSVAKDTGTYFRVTGTRTVARTVAYGSASVARQLKNVEEVPFKCISTAENIVFPMSDFMGLMEKDSLNIDVKGVREIGRQVREARKNLDNLRVSALTQLLFNGQIYFDAQGNLLPSSTGARTTVDFAVPAGNKAQLNWDGNGAILANSWDNAATDIASQLITLRRASERLTGYEVKQAYYGRNVPSYLVNNNTLQGYFMRNMEDRRNAGANQQFIRAADIPSPLLGLSWRPAYSAFFEDANGINQSLVGDDQVMFCPDPSSDWIGWAEGTTPIPSKLVTSGDATAATGGVLNAGGMYAYARLIDDPLSIKMVYGDTFLPMLKVPKCIFIATVRF